MRRALAAGAFLSLVLAACGGGSKDLVSDEATNVLNAHVAEIRIAAAAADAPRIRAEVAELRGVVGQLQNQGKLGDEGAAVILAEAARVEEQAALVTPPTTAPRPTAPIVTGPPKEDGGDEGDRRDGGRGKDKNDD